MATARSLHVALDGNPQIWAGVRIYGLYILQRNREGNPPLLGTGTSLSPHVLGVRLVVPVLLASGGFSHRTIVPPTR